MMIGVQRLLPLNGGAKMGYPIPIESALSAVLKPRYSSAVQACYGFWERAIVNELSNIYSEHFENGNEDCLYNDTSLNRLDSTKS